MLLLAVLSLIVLTEKHKEQLLVVLWENGTRAGQTQMEIKSSNRGFSFPTHHSSQIFKTHSSQISNLIRMQLKISLATQLCFSIGENGKQITGAALGKEKTRRTLD